MLEQIKIGISDTSWQRLAACAPRYRPLPGWDALRHGLMEAMGRDQAAAPPRSERHGHRGPSIHTSAGVSPRKKGRTPTLCHHRWTSAGVTRCWRWRLADGSRVIARPSGPHLMCGVMSGLIFVYRRGRQPGPTRSIIQLGFSVPAGGPLAVRTFSTPDQHLGQQDLSTASTSDTRELIRSDNLKTLPDWSWIAALGRAGREGKRSQYFLFIYLRAQPSILVWASMFFAVFANVSRAFAYKADQNSADEADIYSWHHHITRVLWRQAAMIQRLTLSLCCVNGSCRSGS